MLRSQIKTPIGASDVACPLPRKLFLCAMPTNLYGPGDNYDLNTSHVLPALLRKAISVTNEHQPSMTQPDLRYYPEHNPITLNLGAMLCDVARAG